MQTSKWPAFGKGAVTVGPGPSHTTRVHQPIQGWDSRETATEAPAQKRYPARMWCHPQTPGWATWWPGWMMFPRDEIYLSQGWLSGCTLKCKCKNIATDQIGKIKWEHSQMSSLEGNTTLTEGIDWRGSSVGPKSTEANILHFCVSSILDLAVY